MIPRNFVVLGYEEFKSNLNPIDKEYTNEMNSWTKYHHRDDNMISDKEDLKQREECKNQIFYILNTSREDSVYDALTDFFSVKCFADEKSISSFSINNLRKLLKRISYKVGKNVIRIASWEFFSDKLNYDDYQSYMRCKNDSFL